MANQRGLVQRIERMLEDGVGDVFARVFGGAIVPQEVEALLRREASDGVRALAGGGLLAPNDYTIALGASDYERLRADRELTTAAFARHLDGYIHDQGWQTYGAVVVRLEQADSLHTGQYRARALVNPDAEPDPDPAADPRSSRRAPQPPESNHAYTAESGVPAMTDNPGFRGGRPGDEYYDDQYGRPQDEQAAPSPDPQRSPYPPDQGHPPSYQQGYPPRPPHPEQGGYPEPGYSQGYGPAGGYPQGPGYEQRPPAGGYGGPGYDQGYRQAPPGYAGQPGYPPPPAGGYPPPPAEYDYNQGRPRYDEPGYGRPEPRPAYPDQQGYPPSYGGPHARPEYAQPDYGRYDHGQGGGQAGYAPAPAPGYDSPGYDSPGYDYGQPGGQQGAPQGGYGQPPAGEYAGHAVTLQLDDGSGRTYQLREGTNVIGRGQDAQFRLPDTGVSRRHLEIRWDGQMALLSDLNSTNGTTVNNAPVQEWQLADGDVIRVGHSEIIVHVH